MVTVAVFGSCMSNMTCAYLKNDFGYVQTHCVHHNRSDNFVNLYIDRTTSLMPFEFFSGYTPTAEIGIEATHYLQNQYEEFIGFYQLIENKRPNKTFFDDLRETSIDVLLLDNFMDISALLMQLKEPDRNRYSPIFLNTGFYLEKDELNSKFEFTPLISPSMSAENWLRICRWFRAQQPKAKIFFLPYHYCTSHTNTERYRRIQKFYYQFCKIAQNEDVFIVPPLDLKPEYTLGEDSWPHFQAPVYRALAGYVHVHVIGGLPKPANRVEISSTVSVESSLPALP